MVKTVSILGRKYKVQADVPTHKDKDLMGKFGYCSFIDHRIVVADINTVRGWESESELVKLIQKKATLRHEIIHAFLYESGLWGSSASVESWATNEEMVEWFALQIPKMTKVFEQLDCMEE